MARPRPREAPVMMVSRDEFMGDLVKWCIDGELPCDFDANGELTKRDAAF
jgi:hypothetical protein